MRRHRGAVLAVVAIALVAGCGDEEWPTAGSGPSAYSEETGGGAFEPGARAAGGTAGTGQRAASAPDDGMLSGAAGTSTGGTSGGFGTVPGSGGQQTGFACGGLVCPMSSFCFVQAPTLPSLTPAAECRIIPPNCTSCDCVKPFLSCLCSPVTGGGLMVSCP